MVITEIPNRLSECTTSPYLLQHSSNPVEWQPWNLKSIEMARELDKPMMVSIGYSACHWCHVMRKESFEDPGIASIMNSNFVCIKVDREEHPDVDSFFMKACQALTGGGGWPLNAFVDPHNLRPFYIGTYFPKDPRFGLVSWDQILLAMADIWNNDRQEIASGSVELINHLSENINEKHNSVLRIQEVVEMATKNSIEYSFSTFDTENGGFHKAPKFPHPMELEFLIRNRTDEIDVMIERSLESMANRGLFDQIGGGWHRYCVDEKWTVPHFEKMLYDNALLLKVYSQALRGKIGNLKTKKRVIDLTLEWIVREMLDSRGGAWSTIDADSIDSEGIESEGIFYLWTPEDVKLILDVNDSEIAFNKWGIGEMGNFENGEKNVLSWVENSSVQIESEEIIRKKLLNERSKRKHPLKDDKVITSWNGMLLESCSRMENENAIIIGDCVSKGLMERSTKKDGSVIRSWRNETDGGAGFLEDYAWAALGLLHWGILRDDGEKIKRSMKIAEKLIEMFVDENGGFWFTSKDHGYLPIRQRSEMDSAVPSSTSIAIRLFSTLWNIFPDNKNSDLWIRLSMESIESIGPSLELSGSNYWGMLNSSEYLFKPWSIWFFHHDGEEPDFVSRLRQEANEMQLVFSSENPIGQKNRGDSKWKGWLCKNLHCEEPTNRESDIMWPPIKKI